MVMLHFTWAITRLFMPATHGTASKFPAMLLTVRSLRFEEFLNKTYINRISGAGLFKAGFFLQKNAAAPFFISCGSSFIFIWDKLFSSFTDSVPEVSSSMLLPVLPDVPLLPDVLPVPHSESSSLHQWWKSDFHWWQ